MVGGLMWEGWWVEVVWLAAVDILQGREEIKLEVVIGGRKAGLESNVNIGAWKARARNYEVIIKRCGNGIRKEWRIRREEGII
jgi:hypothetical protein